jgi:hypothetical protein
MTTDLINAIFGPYILLGIFVLTAAMGVRVWRHIRSGRKTPLLLARDILLFAYFALVTVVAQIARAHNIHGLSKEVWWVLITSVLASAVLTVWLGIELGLIRQKRSVPVPHECPACGAPCSG